MRLACIMSECSRSVRKRPNPLSSIKMRGVLLLTLSEQCLLSITFPLKANYKCWNVQQPSCQRQLCIQIWRPIVKTLFSKKPIFCKHCSSLCPQRRKIFCGLINFHLNYYWNSLRCETTVKGPIFTLNCDGPICAARSIQKKLAAAEIMSFSWAPFASSC